MDQYTRPVAGRAALLTIDMQNDFARPDAPATIPGTADIIPQLEHLVEAFRAASRPVVHVIRLYHEDGSNVDSCRRQAVQNGAEIVRPGSQRDFRIVFVPDATSGTYDRGLNELEAIGVALKETDETIDWITG